MCSACRLQRRTTAGADDSSDASSCARSVVQGNVPVSRSWLAAEFNLWMDPEAARIVVDSGVDLTMIGLDVCHRTTFDRDGAAAVRGSGTPLATFVAGTSESWIAVLSSALDQSTAMLPERPHRPVAERRVAAATVRGCER